MFLARNRIIAALAAMTVVVEAGERSGAMVTARLAREIGRPVGAVPGRVTTPQAAGVNGLLAAGACVVRGPQDVLDHVFGAGVRLAGTGAAERPPPPAELRVLLEAIAAGHETAAALARAGLRPEQGLAALAALELGGYVRRGAGGRFSVVP
jgi:DNA processing protein